MRYRFGDLDLDTDTWQLFRGGTEVDLEPQVFGVLAHLVAHRDRIVTKEELLDSVWNSRFVSESALSTRIKQVRQAVGDNGRDQAVVRTLYGRGYRFVAPVVEVDRAVAADGTGPHRVPPTRYADGAGASLAYQTFGEGPDLVLVAGYATNVEVQWEHPGMADFLRRLGTIARVTVLDKRGVGLSDRVPHDSAPPLETRADDLAAVLDAAGVPRATVLGSSEGGSLGAVFAATHPSRVERLVLHNTWVTGPTFPRAGPSDLDFVLRHWGTGRVYAALSPALDRVERGREMLARYERQSATPRTARHLLELIGAVDIAGVLGAITVPTLVLHRKGDPTVPPAHGHQLAEGIPGARLVLLDGEDHNLFSGDPTQILDEVAAFLSAPTTVPRDDGVLATVAFVDVSSPCDDGGGSAIDDGRSAGLVRGVLDRAGGELVEADGGAGGVFATFDGPGRAVRAAAAACEALEELGTPGRAGIHTAEIRRRGERITGLGVDLARRVASHAEPGEVWVTRTVTDLVAGTGLEFERRGDLRVEGVDRPWDLFSLRA